MVADRLNIVADENIPELERYFSMLGNIERVNGRTLTRQQLKEADVLLVRSVTAVNQGLLEGTPVKFVATATIGTDHLDKDYLHRADIGWASAPGCNANSVVDYVFSVLCQRPDRLAELLAGKAVIGIVGMGNVGSRLYQRLRALSIKCVAYDPLIDQSAFSVLTDFETVLAADVVCFHTPLSRQGPYPTFHMVSEQQLGQLKPGAFLINAGRGAAIDNLALKMFLQQGNNLTVALDVWENEPAIDLELMNSVDFVSAHIAGYSLDGKVAGTEIIYKACCKCFGFPAIQQGDDKSLQTLTLKETEDVTTGLKEAVLAVYDIAEDDRLMRGALHIQEVVGEQFDRLRKEYRIRREFSRFAIANSEACSASLVNALSAVGFVCEE